MATNETGGRFFLHGASQQIEGDPALFRKVRPTPPHPPAGRSRSVAEALERKRPSVGAGPALRATLSPKGAKAGVLFMLRGCREAT